MDRPRADHAPPDHIDHDIDHVTATDQPPTDHDLISLDEAAARLGITKNAVRQRLKRGTLAGHKTPAGWVVVVPTDHPTTTDHGRVATDRPPSPGRPTTDHPANRLDVAPLAALIADLRRENRELIETATVLAERNRVLQGRLLALESGDALPPPARPWWRRLWERLA